MTFKELEAAVRAARLKPLPEDLPPWPGLAVYPIPDEVHDWIVEHALELGVEDLRPE